MKSYLAGLAEEYEKVDERLTDEALVKLHGTLRAGARCVWCYEQDVAQWRLEGPCAPPLEQWPYSGLIVPFPNKDGRGKLEVEDVCLIVLDYPIEKENPEVDWTTLTNCLTSPGLHMFHVLMQ
jgi:hypothetical protein